MLVLFYMGKWLSKRSSQVSPEGNQRATELNHREHDACATDQPSSTVSLCQDLAALGQASEDKKECSSGVPFDFDRNVSISRDEGSEINASPKESADAITRKGCHSIMKGAGECSHLASEDFVPRDEGNEGSKNQVPKASHAPAQKSEQSVTGCVEPSPYRNEGMQNRRPCISTVEESYPEKGKCSNPFQGKNGSNTNMKESDKLRNDIHNVRRKNKVLSESERAAVRVKHYQDQSAATSNSTLTKKERLLDSCEQTTIGPDEDIKVIKDRKQKLKDKEESLRKERLGVLRQERREGHIRHAQQRRDKAEKQLRQHRQKTGCEDV